MTSWRTEHTMMGLIFAIDDATPFGDVVLDPVDLKAWLISSETWSSLTLRSPGIKQSVCQIIRNAQSQGSRLVKGVVSPGGRRGQQVSQRPRRGMDDLAERARGLMVQIATLSDAGPIPDGQMSEITKTYAALQGELDDVKAHLAEIEENLSIGRAIIFEYTMPV